MASSEIMEALLRILSIVLLVLTACLVGLDHQTKLLYQIIVRKATYRDLNALYVLVWIQSSAAVYNLLQLFRCYMLPGFRKDGRPSYRYLAWGIYLLDQAAVYVVFAANSATLQGCVFAITGQKDFQWMKLCDRYTRFCIQIGFAIVSGYIATVAMAIISCISAYALFRRYSPRQFLMLKAK